MGGRTAHALKAEGTNSGFFTVMMPHQVAGRLRLERLFWVIANVTSGIFSGPLSIVFSKRNACRSASGDERWI